MHRSRGGRHAALTVLLGAALALALPGVVAGQSSTPSSDPSVAPVASLAPSPAVSVTPASPAPSFAPVPAPAIKLVNAGRKPRAVREYTFTAGATGTMVMEITQGVRTAIGDGAETGFELPTIRYTMAVDVAAVDAAGVGTIVMTVSSLEVLDDPAAEEPLDPALLEQLDTTLQGLVGATITAQTAPDGATLGASADLSGLDPALAQQMTGLVEQANQLSLALPSQPIGKGARWNATTTLTANGITFNARTTATLKAVDGDVLTIAVKSRQTGVPGPVELAGLPAGYAAELVEMDGESSGRTIVDLNGLVPRSSSSGTVRAKLSATDGTSTQTTTTIVTSRLLVRSGE